MTQYRAELWNCNLRTGTREGDTGQNNNNNNNIINNNNNNHNNLKKRCSRRVMMTTRMKPLHLLPLPSFIKQLLVSSTKPNIWVTLVVRTSGTFGTSVFCSAGPSGVSVCRSQSTRST